MKIKYLTNVVILLVLLIIIVSCQASVETVVETVEVVVTRVVTETIVQEGEVVEVTRLVEATVPSREITESAGSEVVVGDAPQAPPSTGPKVSTEETNSSEEVANTGAATGEDRTSEPGGGGETVAEPVPPDRPVTDDGSRREDDLDVLLEPNTRLTAGEVDDNANWDEYLLYLRSYEGAAVIEVNVGERHQIWVEDSSGRPVLGARIEITANGESVTTLRSHSNGLAYFFPRAFSEIADSYEVDVIINGETESFTIAANGSQREWVVTHPGANNLQPETKLDIVFLMDATGSMADEINELKTNIEAISAQIDALPAQPDVRFGMVAYRDQGDAFVTRAFDFTPDVAEFAFALRSVEADGGGDYPEDLNKALSEAINQLEWRVDDTVSLVFLVADAPPHLDYGQENHYGVEMVAAAKRGIKIYPIASSGLDEQGEYIFRQLAQFTGGRFIFLTYGGEGPGTSGTETDFEVSDYTVSALDRLVVNIVQEELSYRIP